MEISKILRTLNKTATQTTPIGAEDDVELVKKVFSDLEMLEDAHIELEDEDKQLANHKLRLKVEDALRESREVLQEIRKVVEKAVASKSVV